MSNHNSYSDQKSSETDPAGTLEKPCSGTFRTQSTTLRESRLRRDWTSLLVNSCTTCSMATKPALQGFGSVPGGSA